MRCVVGVAALLIAGCLDRSLSEVNPQQCHAIYPSSCYPQPVPTSVNRDVDILFVVDDSPGALPLQTSLKAAFPSFINVLNTIEGGLPNLHIGVVSPDLGTKGASDPMSGPAIGSGPGSCSGYGKSGNLQANNAAALGGNLFISDMRSMDGSRFRNYTGTLEDAFAQIASLGDAGCGFEQPLEAAKRALDGNTVNAGFMRPDALLAVIFVQNEDDCSFAHSTLLDVDTSVLGPLQSFRCNRYGHVCSTGGTTSDQMNQVGPKAGCTSNESSPYLTKVADYVTRFKNFKLDAHDVIVAGIAGPTTPYAVELRTPSGSSTAIPAVAYSCSYQGATDLVVADPAVRLKQFLDSFPNRTTFGTACQQDLSGALVQVAELIRTVIGSSCIEGVLADVDPVVPGPQYECWVSDVTNYGKANQYENVLPQCNDLGVLAQSTNKPCWAIVADPQTCSGQYHLRLHVERTERLPIDTVTVAYCVTEA